MIANSQFYEELTGKRIYLDTNILIFLLEGHQDFADQLNDLMRLLTENQVEAYTSDLIFTEILPKPAKEGDEATLNYFLQFLQSGSIHLVSLSRAISIHAGILRGRMTMKTPDALHVATALHTNCQILISNDLGLKIPKDDSLQLKRLTSKAKN